MATDIGEYVVGAYLKYVKSCDVVDYGVRSPAGGLEGLNELDVMGLNFRERTAYLCEVTTHIGGMNIKNYATTVAKVKAKFAAAERYADGCLGNFRQRVFMLWSPRVAEGKLLKQLSEIDGVELIVNEKYTVRVDELRQKARELTGPTTNPFFRTLQILEHLRRSGATR